MHPSTIVASVVIVSCWILAWTLVFGVLVDDDRHERRPGISVRLARWTRHQLSAANRILIRLLGRRLYSRLEHGLRYCVEERNPILPILYVMIMAGVLAVVLAFCRPYMHAPSLLGFVLLYAACIASFAQCSRSSPGVIGHWNHAACLDRYQYDGVLFEAGQVCRTCKLVKIARSKHCRYCDVCVARFDHHCVWVNNCIGANNIASFLSFLVVKSISCMYMTVLVASIIMDVVDQKGLFTRRLISSSGRIVPNSLPNVVRYLIGHQAPLVVLLAFLVPTALFIVGFTLYHCKLLATNTTTNEDLKLEHLKKGGKCPSRFYFDLHGGSIWSNLMETLTRKFPIK